VFGNEETWDFVASEPRRLNDLVVLWAAGKLALKVNAHYFHHPKLNLIAAA
jgi:hypothetical protein